MNNIYDRFLLWRAFRGAEILPVDAPPRPCDDLIMVEVMGEVLNAWLACHPRLRDRVSNSRIVRLNDGRVGVYFCLPTCKVVIISDEVSK